MVLDLAHPRVRCYDRGRIVDPTAVFPTQLAYPSPTHYLSIRGRGIFYQSPPFPEVIQTDAARAVLPDLGPTRWAREPTAVHEQRDPSSLGRKPRSYSYYGPDRHELPLKSQLDAKPAWIRSSIGGREPPIPPTLHRNPDLHRKESSALK